MKTKALISKALTILALAVFAGCGGGGKSPAPSTRVSGVASKGLLAGSTVKVYAIRNGVEDKSTPIGQGVTDTKGAYLVDLGSYQGPFSVEVSSGSYKDEVTGATVQLQVPLRTLIPSITAGSQMTVAATPLTEMAYQKAIGSGSLTATSIIDANIKIAALYQLNDITATLPVDPTVPPPAGTTDDQKKYGAALGSFAQYVNNNKNSGETLADALQRLVTEVGTQIKVTGGLSDTTLSAINTAINDFSNGGNNKTGTTIPAVTPKAGVLRISTTGLLEQSVLIGGIRFNLNLPTGVTVKADNTGQTTPGVVAMSGVAQAAAGTSLSIAKYSAADILASPPTPGKLEIALVNTNGFGIGEFLSVTFDVGEVPFPKATDFTFSGDFTAFRGEVGSETITLTGITPVVSVSTL